MTADDYLVFNLIKVGQGIAMLPTTEKVDGAYLDSDLDCEAIERWLVLWQSIKSLATVQ